MSFPTLSHWAALCFGAAFLLGSTWCHAAPSVPCASVTRYATVTDPIKLAFAPDGTLFVGRDNIGSGGSPGDAVKIHRVAPGGSPVTEYGNLAIADPDAVAYDALGIVSGTPGSVLVGGSAVGTGAVISRIDPGGLVTPLFGGVQFNMNNPGELLFDAAGRLYISDSSSNAVFATSSSATPTALFPLTGAFSMALDQSNRLAVATIAGSVLQYRHPATAALLGTGPAVKASTPVVAGPGGDFWGRDLYAVNSSDQLIRIDSFGNAVVAGTGFSGSLQMAFGPDQALYVSFRDLDVILRIQPLVFPIVPGMTVEHYAGVTDPQTLSFAPNGVLYTGRDNSGSGGTSADAVKVNRIGPCGSPVTEFGNVAILDPDAVAYDAAGIVSGVPGSVLVGGVTGTGVGQISRLAPNGTVTNVFGPNSTVQNPIKFIFANPARLLYTDNATATVMVMTNTTPQLLFATPSPYSLALDGLGRVLVSSLGSAQVRLYSATGVLLSNIFVTAQSRSPLARGPGGVWGTNVYFVATNGNLRSVSPAGVVTEHGTGFAPFEDMEFGPDGALYLSDLESDCVLRVLPPGHVPAPAHWWRGDGNALDSVTGASGVIGNGVTYVPGRSGQAFSMDGTAGSLVELGTNIVNFGTSDFTIAYWFKTTRTNLMVPLGKREFCNPNSLWNINMNGGRVGFEVNGNDGALAQYLTVGTTNNWADNQWHHIALVRSGSALFCYVDAALRGTRATNFVTFVSNAAPARIAYTACAAFNPALVPYQGQMDEIQLYTCALSAFQVALSAGLPDPTLPRLDIASLPNDAVRLSWTTNAPGFVLQTNGPSFAPAAWNALGTTPAVTGTNYVVTNAVNSPARNYRLRKP